MLGQSGSSPLDLFKFYVEDLKSRFHDEKKIIREILKDKNFEVQVNTTFEEFATVVCEDRKSATLDAGNVKLTYNLLLEKAEAREKERVKEETRKFKKLETGFKNLLKTLNVDYQMAWEDVRSKIEEEQDFKAITLESERIRIFKEYQHELEESCSHHHIRSKKKKAKKLKRKSRSRSHSVSVIENSHFLIISDREKCKIDVFFSWQESEGSEKGLRRKRHKSHSPSIPSKSDSSESETRKSKRKKNKKKRGRSHSVHINNIKIPQRKFPNFITFFLIFFHSARTPVFHPLRNPRTGNGSRRSIEGLLFTVKVPLQKITNTTNFPRTSWKSKERNFYASSKCNKRRIDDFGKCISQMDFQKSEIIIYSLFDDNYFRRCEFFIWAPSFFQELRMY